MSTPTAKVADIFTTAGEAFTRLGQLAVQLHPTDGDGSTQASKWGPEEIEMLRTAVKKFGQDMKQISDHIKTRSVAQIKTALKQRMHEEGGIIVSPPTTPKKRPQKKPSNQDHEPVVKKIKIDTSGSDSVTQLTSDPMMPQIGQLGTHQGQAEQESIVDIENIFEQGEHRHTVLSQHELDPSLRTQMAVSDLLSESVNIL